MVLNTIIGNYVDFNLIKSLIHLKRESNFELITFFLTRKNKMFSLEPLSFRSINIYK